MKRTRNRKITAVATRRKHAQVKSVRSRRIPATVHIMSNFDNWLHDPGARENMCGGLGMVNQCSSSGHESAN
jgi:hypothetical protein